MKRYKITSIRSGRIYDTKMICKLLGTHKQTVNRWVKQGLNVLDDSRQVKIMGKDLIQFLESCRTKHRHPLGPGQFFCTTCHAARDAAPGSLWLENTGIRIGKDTVQVIIHASCSVCRGKTFLFSTEAKGKAYVT